MEWLIGSGHAEAKRWVSQLSDPNKRERAAAELIRLGAEAAPTLIEALPARDTNLPPFIAPVLVRIGSPAIPALTKALCETHPLVRVQIADILGQIKDRAVLPALLEALRGEYYTVRAHSATALGNIGDVQAIQALSAALKDSESQVRIAAVEALGNFRDPNTFDEIANLLLDDPIIEVRQAAARALGKTKHPAALGYLMEALHDSFWWYERETAASDLLEAIEAIGAPAVNPLIEALNDPEATIRRFAAILLGKLGDARAIEPLGMSLYDLHHEVGKTAAEALTHFGGASFEVLAEALRHPETGIREQAVIALGKIQDARVPSVLIKMLKDPERSVQKQTIQALAHMRNEHVTLVLRELAANRTDRELSALAKQALATTR